MRWFVLLTAALAGCAEPAPRFAIYPVVGISNTGEEFQGTTRVNLATLKAESVVRTSSGASCVSRGDSDDQSRADKLCHLR